MTFDRAHGEQAIRGNSGVSGNATRDGGSKAERNEAKGKLLKTNPVGSDLVIDHLNESKRKGAKGSLKFDRYFTRHLPAGKSPLDAITYIKRSSRIKDTDGGTVFEMKNVEVPEGWSQLAVDILVSKYFRKAGVPQTGHEISVRQVVNRIAKTIRKWGEAHGYFDKENAQVFEDELLYLLVTQRGAFNSPVWFNLGLFHEYGIEGSGGNFAWDMKHQCVTETPNAYERPQCSACFIQAAQDDLMEIFQLVKNEARLFKYGSGTGSNFSRIRGRQEKLSGGGLSSGLMSFLEVFDRGAGATKSGGTTRRAAKMVCLDLDHPEIMDFITWKMREERKVAALIAAGYSSDFNGEAYKTVAGQNSNNSVRVTDDFMHAVEAGGKWHTTSRTNGEILESHDARKMWRTISEASWACADPGIQFDSTINDWHTCANTDRIRASNPCSEYMFLDDTACNLASINLVKFLKEPSKNAGKAEESGFDIEGFRKACRAFIVAQEILVDLSSYPTKKIAQNSHDYRPLGLGYANLGTLLMLKGIPYDSEAARAWAASITGIMCGHAYAVSAEEAGQLGAFAGYEKNREPMLKVIRKHRDAALKVSQKYVPAELADASVEDWNQALKLGERFGYRNSQVTVLAPTGTIGLLMDCDTTGIEPDFALVKFKKLAGGGYFKIVNQSVPLALKNLGYTEVQIEEILHYLLGSMSLKGAPHVNEKFLAEKGLEKSEIEKIEKSLPGTFELSSAFTRYALGDETLKRLGVSSEAYEAPTFNFLKWAGLSEAQLAEANLYICGTMTVEGAPHLKEEHLPVFDCANKCGATGKRFIAPMGHVRMMAATQPFLSGAISKTVNLPNETTVEEVENIHYEAWKLGLKAIALYRDGCKLSQPLSTKSDKKTEASVGPSPEEIDQRVKVLAESMVQERMKEMQRQAASGVQTAFMPSRRKLPAKRRGFTQEASISGHKIYMRTGEYADGALGEIFIDMHKEGAAYRSMMNCFAIAVSLGLQYGVPLKEFVDKFTFTRFEPSGPVDGHPNIKMSTSVVDYLFRVLGMEYLGRTDFLQVKPAPKVEDLTPVSEQSGSSANIAAGIGLEGMKPQMELQIKQTQTEAHLSVLATMMGDAPPCDSCGHTTVRNGACYRCLNCGNSMGCS